MGLVRQCSSTARSAVQAVWFWRLSLLGKARNEANTTHKRRGGGSPLGGRTGHNPAAWAKGAKRLAHNGWAGANTTDSAQRLTKTPCAGAAGTGTLAMDVSKRGECYGTRALAARAGQGAQDITGVG